MEQLAEPEQQVRCRVEVPCPDLESGVHEAAENGRFARHDPETTPGIGGKCMRGIEAGRHGNHPTR